VSTKLWDRPTWNESTRLVLPARISVGEDGYWLVKVKPAAIGWFKLRAICV
jgi:hypothetical protein